MTNLGRDWEWVVIDLEYEDDTFGYSQPMYRYQAKVAIDKQLAVGAGVHGTNKRVKKAQIVFLDPQPTVVLVPDEAPIQ